jgi:hypothetical protein
MSNPNFSNVPKAKSILTWIAIVGASGLGLAAVPALMLLGFLFAPKVEQSLTEPVAVAAALTSTPGPLPAPKPVVDRASQIEATDFGRASSGRGWLGRPDRVSNNLADAPLSFGAKSRQAVRTDRRLRRVVSTF